MSAASFGRTTAVDSTGFDYHRDGIAAKIPQAPGNFHGA
jgi:hypothetical protein